MNLSHFIFKPNHRPGGGGGGTTHTHTHTHSSTLSLLISRRPWGSRGREAAAASTSKHNIWVSVSNVSPLICITRFLTLAEGILKPCHNYMISFWTRLNIVFVRVSLRNNRFDKVATDGNSGVWVASLRTVLCSVDLSCYTSRLSKILMDHVCFPASVKASLPSW